jgi:hypothetical protein
MAGTDSTTTQSTSAGRLIEVLGNEHAALITALTRDLSGPMCFELADAIRRTTVARTTPAPDGPAVTGEVQHFHPAFLVGIAQQTTENMRSVADPIRLRRMIAELRTQLSMVRPEFDVAVARGRQHARMDALLYGEGDVPPRRLGRGIDTLLGGGGHGAA